MQGDFSINNMDKITSRSNSKFKNYLKTYESSYSTEKDGHLSVHVCDCANGKRKTHHGYKWIWECDYLDMIGGALS